MYLARKKSIGERIRNARRKRSFTVDELAVLLNVDLATIYTYELETAIPDAKTLELLSTFLQEDFTKEA